jgi:hypothetical protein
LRFCVSITISRPRPNTGVQWTFTVTGDYDLGTALRSAPQTSLGTIVVTVYENDGTTPLPNTTVTPSSITISAGQPSGKWDVSVTHAADYSGAVVVAVLTPTGGTAQEDMVTGIDISQ